ncbi:hypothetical protein DPMN_135695 [Dreissena polymorpha]|uniref:GPS domain-containing protein n=1 Tax=Dreissena polymorpha TaxID=45954 RepID=A0A9D4FZK0_DREPO|nr:hypothetical protein DPMN_135695 [Dreissena polymorpha]
MCSQQEYGPSSFVHIGCFVDVIHPPSGADSFEACVIDCRNFTYSFIMNISDQSIPIQSSFACWCTNYHNATQEPDTACYSRCYPESRPCGNNQGLYSVYRNEGCVFPIILNGFCNLLNQTNTTNGSLANVTCDAGYESNVSQIMCQANTTWQTAICNRTGNVTSLVNQILKMTANVKSPEVTEALSGIAYVTDYDNNPILSQLPTNAEIALLTYALDFVANLVLNNTGLATSGVAKPFLQSASNIIGIIIEKENNGTWLTLEQANENTTETLLSLTDTFGSAVRKRIADSNNGTMTVVTKNIAFEVMKVIEGAVLFPDDYVTNYTDNDSKWILQSKNIIFLNTSTLGAVVATAVIFRNLTHVMSARSEFNRASTDGVIVNGPVMSCSISNGSTILVSPIILTFEHGQANFIKATCNYWKFSSINSPGYWASDGCRFRASNDTITVCECDHLTNFAVLMSPFVEVG